MIFYVLSWIDWPSAYVLVAGMGTVAAAWLHERRESRAELRRGDAVVKLEHDVDHLRRDLENCDSALQTAERVVSRHEAQIREIMDRTRTLDP